MLVHYLWWMMTVFGILSIVITPVLVFINTRYTKGQPGLDRMNLAGVSSMPARLPWLHVACSFIVGGVFILVLRQEHQHCAKLFKRQSVDLPHVLVVQGVPSGISKLALSAKYGVKSNAVTFGTSYSSISQARLRRDRVRSRFEDILVHLIGKAVRQVTYAGGSEGNGWRDTENALSAILGPQTRSRSGLISKFPSTDRSHTDLDSLLKELQTSQRHLDLAYHHYQEHRSIAIFRFPNHEAARAALLTDQTATSIWRRAFVVQKRALRLENVGVSVLERSLREIGARLAATIFCVCWVLPSTLVGALSQLSVLPFYITWLTWLHRMPLWSLGTIQGVLPQVLATILFHTFPPVLRWMVSIRKSLVTWSDEVIIQRYYFAFLYIQLFFIVSVSASILTTIYRIANMPDSVATILAQNLPASSNYFLSYLLIQGMMAVALTFSQPIRLFGDYWSGSRHRTPRQLLVQEESRIQWGTTFPVYTNLACIGR